MIRGIRWTRPDRRTTLRLILLTLAAVVAGIAQFASYQPTGLWWAAPLGLSVLFVVVDHVSTRTDHPTRWIMWLTWVQGLTCYLFLLPWVGKYVGAIAWIGLSVVESLYCLAFGAGLAFLLRRWPRHPLLLVTVPAWYVAVEWVRVNWPFGGFGWARLAWGQLGGPLAQWISVAGPALVAFAVIVTGYALSLLVHRRWISGAVPVALTLVGGLLIPVISPVWSDGDDSPTLNIAAVQGNVPRMGLDFNAQREAVLNNHVRVSRELADEVAAGERPQPDLVVWPENASDVDPYRNREAYDKIQGVAAQLGAPVLVGAVTRDVVGDRNAIIVWDPADGPGQQHVKKYLQPFGEYMPLRDLLRHVSSYVDMAGDFKPGDGDNTVDAAGRTIGVATCYEVSFDEAYRDAVRHGATVFTSPTNNATFGTTDMTFQQLAINRMRAIEYDRAVVVAATSGVSAIVTPDGAVDQRTTIFREGLLQADIPVRDTETLSARVGPVVEWILVALGAVAVAVAYATTRSTRPSRSNPPTRTRTKR
ncbi:apolipoprotein N-acyltransferase [uncultured Corynebacterium sp.]|uniref:apolipoprotein N-acyltransferase n=1 Tax=uncultured Corynebacterium sp. TaxID=159447 RepID=UPI0025FB2213|nr:apolipoprotein N-acyltransferase [uncultured Corynebacterium sp.]